MITGIGVDIVAIERFQRFLDEGNCGVLERLFTDAERYTCSTRKDSASCLAARFAAKEAFMKALGTGLRDGITWQDVEVVSDEMGKPDLVLTGRADQLFRNMGLNTALLSLSHDGGYAAAMVVMEVL